MLFRSHRKPGFDFLNADPLFGNLKETHSSGPTGQGNTTDPGKGAGEPAFWSGCDAVFITPHSPAYYWQMCSPWTTKSVNSGHGSFSSFPETQDCCIICLTETWLSAEIPSEAIEPAGFSVHRPDRTKDLSGNSKEGRGMLGVIRGTFTSSSLSAPQTWNI